MGLKYRKRKSKKSSPVKNKLSKSKEKPIEKVNAPEGKDFLQIGYRFKNNDEKWMAIALTENCSITESYRLVERELEEIFGDGVVYFLPMYLEKRKVSSSVFELFEGYVFVKCSETVNVNKFPKKTNYMDKVLYKGSNPYFVTNRVINKFKTRIKRDLLKKLPKIGNKVLVKDGTFSNQEGIVKSVNKRDKTAIIEFRKRTRIVTAKLSVTSFEVANE